MAFNYSIHCNNQKTIYLDRDNQTLDAYYNDVRRFPLLTETEERKLINKYNFGKTEKERQEAKDKLITSNLRFVISIAKKLGNNETFLDLVEEGNLGLIRAIEMFDPHQKYKLTTYAVSWIVAYVKKYQIKHTKSVVPKNAMKLHDYVKNVSREFFIKNEREPTPQEITDMIREKFNFNISNLEDVELGKIISIDEKVNLSEDSSTIEDSNLYTSRTSSLNSVNNMIEEEHKEEQLNFFLGKLSDRERTIVQKYYGVNGYEQQSYETIAIEMKICSERVRQICIEAIKKMQKYKN